VVFILTGLFILGSAVGSFLNVVIDRSVEEKGVFGGSLRSQCDYCKATLSSVDLIPIISFAGLGGKCRRCKKKLSWQYPFVEALCGSLFALSFYVLGSFGAVSLWLLLYFLFLICIFIVVAVIDIKFSLIPTTFVFFAAAVSLFYNYFFLDSALFVQNVLTAFLLAAFFFALFLITKGRGMGSGDIPLAFLIGMVLGWPNAIAAMFLAFTSGALISILLVIFGKKGLKQTIPFGPFLAASALVVMFWGRQIVDFYLSFI